MFPQIEVQHSIGNTLTISNELDIRAVTYLSDNTDIAATNIPVENAIDFSTGTKLVMLDEIGAENAEIVTQTAVLPQAVTTLATLMAHNRGEAIQQLNYDQIVISRSSTIDGSYSAIATAVMQVKQEKTIIFDSAGLSTDFYKVQWKNSLTAALSPLSDPISVSTYSSDTVGALIQPVLLAMGVSENDPKITTQFCISAIQDGRLLTQALLYGIRQPWQEKFEFPTKLFAGTNFIPLPEDIDYQETDRSVLAARFLIDNILTPYNLKYIDKRSWNQVAFSVMGSSPVNDVHIGDTDIQLENTGDFWDVNGGSVAVATTGFDQDIMWLEYASNDKTTNTLHGVVGVTRDVPAGTQMWTRPSISQPIYYTVYSDRLVFDRIIPENMQGFNIYLDYYAKMVPVVNLYDIIPEHYREIYKWYLRFAIKYRKDIALPKDDPDLIRFQTLVKAVFDNMYTGQDTTIITT